MSFKKGREKIPYFTNCMQTSIYESYSQILCKPELMKVIPGPDKKNNNNKTSKWPCKCLHYNYGRLGKHGANVLSLSFSLPLSLSLFLSFSLFLSLSLFSLSLSFFLSLSLSLFYLSISLSFSPSLSLSLSRKNRCL